MSLTVWRRARTRARPLFPPRRPQSLRFSYRLRLLPKQTSRKSRLCQSRESPSSPLPELPRDSLPRPCVWPLDQSSRARPRLRTLLLILLRSPQSSSSSVKLKPARRLVSSVLKPPHSLLGPHSSVVLRSVRLLPSLLLVSKLEPESLFLAVPRPRLWSQPLSWTLYLDSSSALKLLPSPPEHLSTRRVWFSCVPRSLLLASTLARKSSFPTCPSFCPRLRSLLLAFPPPLESGSALMHSTLR